MLIRVDPSILLQNSGSIAVIGSDVNTTGQASASLAQGAPSYDGQFGPRVQAIGNEALARAQGLFSQMTSLSSQLQSRAQAFTAADTAGIAGFSNISSAPQALGPWSWLNGLPIDKINIYIWLGKLFGGTPFFGLMLALLLGNGLSSTDWGALFGGVKPGWWPSGMPWPFGKPQPVKSGPLPQTTVAPPTGIVDAPVNENADSSDCVAFVKGQPGWGGSNVPPNATRMDGGWAGGERDEGWNYGDEPKPGAIMIEPKSDIPKIGATIDKVDWGHVSYVKSVEYDQNGTPIKFTVVEGRWGNPSGEHEQIFDWPITNSTRSPEVFVYGKK
jgi:hypothetical protein